jgi:endonuclease YncB( thermonuclease family)
MQETMNRTPRITPLILAALLSCATSFSAQPAFTATCTRVIDGDSFVVTLDGEEMTIELAFIDAPETDQPWGAEAQTFLAEAIEGKEVSIRPLSGVSENPLVAVVLVDTESLQTQILDGGHAWHDTLHDDHENLVLAEMIARSSKKGLWADLDPMAPWQWRKTHDRKPTPTPKPHRRRLGDVAATMDLKTGEDGRTVITQPTPSAARGAKDGGSRAKVIKGKDRYCCCEFSYLPGGATDIDEATIIYEPILTYTCENSFGSLDRQTGEAKLPKGCVNDILCGLLSDPSEAIGH